MKNIFFIAVFTILGCSTIPHKVDSELRKPATDTSTSDYGKAEIAPTQNLRFENLKDILINNNVSSIEQALPIH